MRRIPLSVLVVSVVVVWAANASSRDVAPPTFAEAPGRPLADGPTPLAPGGVELPVIGYWNFDNGFGGPDPQGWTTADRTAQIGTFFHVDNFGSFIHGVIFNPLNDAQSLWCGAAPCVGQEVCNYAALPGYGNGWDQRFQSIAFTASNDVTIGFRMRYDVEPLYDFVYLDYRGVAGTWQNIASLTGIGLATYSYVVDSADHQGSIQFRFRVVSDGVYSDEDGGYPSEGAAVIDNLSVADGATIIDSQSFEGEAVGALATADGHWSASVRPPYGDYGGLFDGNAVLQQDPAITNTTSLWGFFNGSTANYGCGGHASQAAVPYVQYFEGDPRYIESEIRSPTVSLAGVPPTSPVLLSFDVYRDLPLANLLFYRWYVRSRVGGSWKPWTTNGIVYYSAVTSWYSHNQDIRSRIAAGATDIQVAIGVFDGCGIWCGTPVGTGACHSHAPLIDNVRLATVPTNTPPGPNVVVTPPDLNTGTTPVTVTFDQITASGVTTLVTGTAGPVPPGTFTLGDGVYYDLATTATFTGNVTVCLSYNPATLVVPEASLRLLHWNPIATPPSWTDITTSLDLVAHRICGVTSSLSPFVFGGGSLTGVDDAPRDFVLSQNVPNPFNPSTTINYQVPNGGADVSIRIYDVAGRLVRTLVDEHRPAGTHAVAWDGRNQAGTRVASGVYIYRMTAGSFSDARRMVLLK